MDALTKWQFNQNIEKEDLITVLNELYSGAKKKLIFSKKTSFNPFFISLYENFKQGDSNCVLKFSLEKTERPFVSINEIEDSTPTHVIKSNEITLFIYD